MEGYFQGDYEVMCIFMGYSVHFMNNVMRSPVYTQIEVLIPIFSRKFIINYLILKYSIRSNLIMDLEF